MKVFASVRRPSASVRVLVSVIALVAFGSRARVAPAKLAAVPPTSIDLSTFVRVGIFDLPEPTRTAAPPNSLLAQEASAVTYNWDTGTLFVVGDGGTSVVQVTKTGALVNSMTLALGSSPQGTEFYDTEGLTYIGGGQFVLIEERFRQVNLFTYVAGATLHRTDVQTVKLGTTVGNVGLEGLSYDPFTAGYILVKEKDPESIFQTNIFFSFGNTGTATNGSPTSTFSTDLFPPALANLADFSDVFSLSNLPFLSGQPDFSHLLVLSQESGQIINVDRLGNVSSRLTIATAPGSSLGVGDLTIEGVTMDHEGNLYIVNENGGGDPSHPQIWVYAHSDAPNQAPTGVTLGNVVSTIPQNTSTAFASKVADILVADDGLGVNNLTLSGPNAAAFQIIGSALFLRAGVALAVQPYSVTITVDDPAVGASPDAQVNYLLTVTPAVGGTASLIISEIAPWSSGSSPAALRVDWFELTNVGTATANIAGWRVDDGSASFSTSFTLNGVTSLAPGESAIFMELGDPTPATLAAKKPAFLNTWFGANPPANLQVGSYSGGGLGLSTDGDGVTIFNGAGVLQAIVVFGASPTGPFKTFDNHFGPDGITLVVELSATGVRGAFAAAADAAEIGSPGTIGPPAAPVVSIETQDSSASETGPDSGRFRISRTGSVVSPLTVNYSVDGGAGKAGSSDVSPALTNSVIIPAGQAFVDLIVTPVDDALFEETETLTLTVFDTGSYDVGTAANASVTITDNETVARSGIVRDRRTGWYAQQLTMQVFSGGTLGGPVYVVLDSLTPGVTLANASGAAGGAPYILVPGSESGIAGGAIASVTLQFTNPSNGLIAYTARVVSGIPK